MRSSKKTKIALLVILLLLFCWQVVQAPWFFAIRAISVEGSTLLSPWEVEQIAGISRGMNLLKVDLNQVRDRLVADNRIVAAEVRRSIPGTLRIQIEENVGVAAIPAFTGWLEIDKTGRVLAVTKDFASLNLPVISGLRHGFLTVGQRLPDNSGWAVAQECLSTMSPYMLSQISEINVANSNSIVLWTRDPLRIVIGDAGNLQQKVQALVSMLDKVRTDKKTTLASGQLDVSSGRAVFVANKKP